MVRKVSQRQRRIYRRRRIAVAVALLVVIVMFVGVLWGIGQLAGAVDRWVHRGDLNVLTRAGVPEPQREDGVRDCGQGDVTLSLSVRSPRTVVGGSVVFSVAIEHHGQDSCLIDASNSSRVLVIASGRETVWRSDSCPSDSRMLLMAGGDRDIQTVQWGADSTGGTCTAAEARPKVRRGSYVAQLHLRGQPGVVSQRVPVLVE